MPSKKTTPVATPTPVAAAASAIPAVTPTTATKPAPSAVATKPAPVATAKAAATIKPVTPAKKAPAAKPAQAVVAKALVTKALAAKSVASPAAKVPAKTVTKPTKATKPEKLEKPKTAKLVRDSFTMPEDEYSHLAALKKRLLALGVAAKKGELLRAGLALLAVQKDADLLVQLKKIPALKTGRPAK